MSDERWPDLAGRLVEDPAGRRHVLPVRVYFEDTDFSGLVYHGSYVRWCERGRSDFLRLLGGDHRRLIDGSGSSEPAAFVVGPYHLHAQQQRQGGAAVLVRCGRCPIAAGF